jgi:hypothetical protein
MKSLRFQLNAKQLAYMFAGILSIGSIISGYFDPDKRWIEWHFSRLGEGGTFSSIIFNVTLIISAIIIYLIGIELANGILNIRNISEVAQNRAKNIVSNGLKVVAGCLVLVSIFPFDRFPVIHNIFGYSMLFIFLCICISIVNILPIFSKKFLIYSYMITLICVICYTLYLGLKTFSLLTVELITFVLVFIWLLLFINDISGANTTEKLKPNNK